MSASDEIASVRERIARVEYEFHHPPDKELAWCRIKDEPRFASLVAVYYGRADAVLDALGLEQVGWVSAARHLLYSEGDKARNPHMTLEPVYRLTAQSGRSEPS